MDWLGTWEIKKTEEEKTGMSLLSALGLPKWAWPGRLLQGMKLDAWTVDAEGVARPMRQEGN